MPDLEPVRLNPAYRHGGPDAGWYRRTMGGWLRISDTEAANERYEDMRHFMHDPRTVAAMDKPDDMAPEVTVIPSGSLSAGDRVQLRAEGVIHSTHATITDGTDEAEA